MKEEYQAIVEAGFLLQIDSPDLAMGLNLQYPDKTLDEYRKIIGVRVEALNHALAGIPREQVRHHICWGNGEAPHHRDVELKGIIDVLLRVNAGAIYVEGANPRHGHEWKVFRDVELPDCMLVIESPQSSAASLHRLGQAAGLVRRGSTGYQATLGVSRHH